MSDTDINKVPGVWKSSVGVRSLTIQSRWFDIRGSSGLVDQSGQGLEVKIMSLGHS